MECRNCRCHLETDCRYCPRCGTPTALGWPTAGAPWLRRPAAVIALALLLIAWLVALQRAIWLPPRLPAGAPRMSSPGAVIAERPPEAPPAPSLPAAGPAASPQPAPVFPDTRSSPAPPRPTPARPAARALPGEDRRGIMPRPQPARAAIPRPRPRPRLAYLPRPKAARSRPPLPGAGRPPAAGARSRRSTTTLVRNRTARPLVPARFQFSASWRTRARVTDTTVDLSVRPYGPRTYVYLNGGRELGIAPLAVRFDRPGRYKLLFWTPDLSRRVTRTVRVAGRGRQWVSVTMSPSRELARDVGR